MKSSVPTTEDLMKLREITRMSGALANAQMAQLKMWPQVILGARKAEIEFDPEEKVVAAYVENLDYKSMLEGATMDPVSLYNIRMDKFDQAVKWLLGDEYAVRVILKDKVIGDFPPKSSGTVNPSFCPGCAATKKGDTCAKHPIEVKK